MSMGQTIASRRKELGIKQSELASRMGVSQPIVARWESDQARPRANKLTLLAEALELQVEELRQEAPLLNSQVLRERPMLGELMQYLPRLENYQLEALCVVARDMATRSQMDRLLKA